MLTSNSEFIKITASSFNNGYGSDQSGSGIYVQSSVDVQILDLFVHGSRIYGKPRRNSDVDVVLYYEGAVREDSLFNILHDDEYEDIFTYDGITIDINPIRDQETGSLESYKKKHNYI